MNNRASFLSEYMRELIKIEVPQFQLLDSRRFLRFLEVRDIRMREEELGHFEKIGFLYPILRLKRPKIEKDGRIRYAGISSSAWYLKRYLEAGLLEFPNSMNVRPWDEYRDKQGEQNTFIYYHPYQVFLIHRFLSLTRIMVTSSYLEMATEIEHARAFKREKKFHEEIKKSFIKARPRLIRQIGLFLQLQNAYQPDYRGTVQLTFPTEESFDRWVDWRQNRFSPSEVLKDSGMSLEEVKDLRDYFAVQAHFIDPMSRWYPLIRLVPFTKKEKLKGKALLAQDYYEIVGILNFFLRDSTKEEQPDPDDIVDGRRGEWKDGYYGKKFDYKDPDIRKRIISDYLNVPIPKVVLLIEGDTEETVIDILMNAFGIVPENEGIAIHNFEGTGGITPFNAGATLQIAKSQNVARYLIIDNDPGAEELVKELSERLKLLDDDCYRIWEKDFEYDNFGPDAVVETVNERLVGNGLAPIETNEVDDRIANHPEEKLWKAMNNTCWMKNKVKLDDVISKTSLARTLSMKRAEEIRQEIKNDKYKPKWKIEEEIVKIYEKFCR